MSRWLPVTPWREDLVGTVLSALGLGLIVYGILRSGTWGFVQPKAGAPQWLRLSPVIWLILSGGAVLHAFMSWESHRLRRGRAVLVDPAMLRNRTLRGGLISFLFQYLLQAGLFFAVPLFLSVSLGLSARSRPACGCCRYPWLCCWPPQVSPRSSPTPPPGAWFRSDSYCCSPAS